MNCDYYRMVDRSKMEILDFKGFARKKRNHHDRVVETLEEIRNEDYLVFPKLQGCNASNVCLIDSCTGRRGCGVKTEGRSPNAGQGHDLPDGRHKKPPAAEAQLYREGLLSFFRS